MFFVCFLQKFSLLFVLLIMGAKLSKKVNDGVIKDEVNEYPVVMYSKPHCGYCKLAKHLFREEGIDFKERDLNSTEKLMASEGKNFQVC
jgi:hypothetical protein